MNQAHFHLLVNHLPIIFPVVGILVMLAAFVSKSEVVKRTAYFIFVMGAVTAIAAMASGDGAAEIVDKITGSSKEIIETHEDASKTFALFSFLLGAVSLFGFWSSLKQKSFSKMVGYVTLVFAFVIMYFGQQAGTTGGEIRHTEIRSSQNITLQQDAQANEHDD